MLILDERPYNGVSPSLQIQAEFSGEWLVLEKGSEDGHPEWVHEQIGIEPESEFDLAQVIDWALAQWVPGCGHMFIQTWKYQAWWRDRKIDRAYAVKQAARKAAKEASKISET